MGQLKDAGRTCGHETRSFWQVQSCRLGLSVIRFDWKSSPRRGDPRDPLAGIETRARTRPGTLRLALALLLLAPLFTEDVQGQNISIEPVPCGIRLTAPSRADAVEYRWRASTISGRCQTGGGATSVITVSGPSFDLGTTTSPSLDSVPTANLTYYFQVDAVDASGQVLSTSTGPYFTSTTGSWSWDCVHNSCRIFLTAGGRPLIYGSSGIVHAWPGETISLRTTATSISPLQFAWERNGVPVPAAEDSVLAWTCSAADSGASFRCVVANSCGISVSPPLAIAVDSRPPFAAGRFEHFTRVVSTSRVPTPECTSVPPSEVISQNANSVAGVTPMPTGFRLQRQVQGACLQLKSDLTTVEMRVDRYSRISITGKHLISAGSACFSLDGSLATTVSGPDISIVLPKAASITPVTMDLPPGTYVLNCNAVSKSPTFYGDCPFRCPANIDVDLLIAVDPIPTINVPQDRPSIQSAIDSAPTSSPTVIQVAPGIYRERITIPSKPVRIVGAGIDLTVIDATGLSSTAVTFLQGCGPDSYLERLTVRGGTGSPSPSSPAYSIAGGLLVDRCAPTISACKFTGNSAPYGGGAYIFWSPSPGVTFRDCIFEGNSATSFGGGVDVYEAWCTFNTCTFSSNFAPVRGGAIHSSNGSGTIEPDPRIVLSGCTITGNSSGRGAAVDHDDMEPGVPLLMQSCTITGNTSTDSFPGNAVIAGAQVGIIEMSGSQACSNQPRNVQPQCLTQDSSANTICDCLADINRDGIVNGADISSVLSFWGPDPALPAADISGDGVVDGHDLASLLGSWGPCPN